VGYAVAWLYSSALSVGSRLGSRAPTSEAAIYCVVPLETKASRSDCGGGVRSALTQARLRLAACGGVIGATLAAAAAFFRVGAGFLSSAA
jgi:hypothetical protein